MSLGTECKASYNGKWYKAEITELCPDGHVRVKFKKFNYSPRLALSELRFSSNSAVISASRCDYAEGDTVEVYFQGKWLGARVAKVIQEGYSYGVQYLNQRHARKNSLTKNSQTAIHRFSPEKMRPRKSSTAGSAAAMGMANPYTIIGTPVSTSITAGTVYPTSNIQPATAAVAVAYPTPSAAYPTPSLIHTTTAGVAPSVVYPTSAYPAPSVVAYPPPVPIQPAGVTPSVAYPPPVPIQPAGVTPSVVYPTPVPIQSAGVGIPVQPAGPAAPIQCPTPAPVYPTPSPIHAVSAGMTPSVAYPTQAYPAPSLVSYPTPVPIQPAVIGVPVATAGTSYPTPLPGVLTVTGTVVAVMPTLVVTNTARPVATGDECQALYKKKWYTARMVKILDGGKKYKVSFVDFKYQPTLRASQVRFSSK